MTGLRHERLGDILLQHELISEEELEQALKTQGQVGRRLGEILVRLGFISENDMSWALAKQLNLPCVSAIETRPEYIDRKALHTIPRRLAYQYHILPVMMTDEELTVVTDDPLNKEAFDEIQQLTGLMLNVAAAPTTEIIEALDTLYALSDSLSPSEVATEKGGLESKVQVCDPLEIWLERAVSSGSGRLVMEPGALDGVPRVRIKELSPDRRTRRIEQRVAPDVYRSVLRALKRVAMIDSFEVPQVRRFEYKSYQGTIAFGKMPGGVTAAVSIQLPEHTFRWPKEWARKMEAQIRGPGIWLIGSRTSELWPPTVWALRAAFGVDRRILGENIDGLLGIEQIDYSSSVLASLIALEPDVLVLPARARIPLIQRLRDGLPRCAILLHVGTRDPVRSLQVFAAGGVTGPEVAEMVRGVLCVDALDPTRAAAEGRYWKIPILGWYRLGGASQDALARSEPIDSIEHLLTPGPIALPVAQVRDYLERGLISEKSADVFLNVALC